MSFDASGLPRPSEASWQPDPLRRHQWRYYDGTVWTEHVADDGVQAEDPLPPPPASPAGPGGAAGQAHPWDGPPSSPQQGVQGGPPGPGQPGAWGGPPGPGQQPVWGGQPGYGQPGGYGGQPGYGQPGGYGGQPGAWAPPQVAWSQSAAQTPPGGLSFPDAVRRCLTKYADFTGRAPRSEYWWFSLFLFLVFFGLAFVGAFFSVALGGGATGLEILPSLALLGFLLPSLAVSVRRLHDTDKSGWFLLFGFVPFVGGIVLLVFVLMDGDPRPNRYGPSTRY